MDDIYFLSCLHWRFGGYPFRGDTIVVYQSMGVRVHGNLWDGVAPPGFKEGHILAIMCAVISIEHI